MLILSNYCPKYLTGSVYKVLPVFLLLINLQLVSAQQNTEYHAVSSEKGQINKLAFYYLQGHYTGSCQLCYVERTFCNAASTLQIPEARQLFFVGSTPFPNDKQTLNWLNNHYPHIYPSTFNDLILNYFPNDSTTHTWIERVNRNKGIADKDLLNEFQARLDTQLISNCNFCINESRYPACISSSFTSNKANQFTLLEREDTALSYRCKPRSDYLFIQDHYWVTQNNLGDLKIIFSKDNSFARKSILNLINNLSGIAIDTLPSDYINIEGGNMLVGNKFVIIGEDFFHCNYEKFKKTFPDTTLFRMKIETDLKSMLGKEIDYIIWSGLKNNTVKYPYQRDLTEYKSHQPIFHVDMYITLGGQIHNEEIIFIGNSLPEYYTKSTLDTNNEFGKHRREIVKQLNDYLGEIKKDFINHLAAKKINFRFIEEIPIIIRFENEEIIKEIKSYNNCIVENIKHNSPGTIFCPDFIGGDGPIIHDFDFIKKKVQKIYKDDMKYNLIFMEPPYDDINNGALNCITKVLSRKN